MKPPADTGTPLSVASVVTSLLLSVHSADTVNQPTDRLTLVGTSAADARGGVSSLTNTAAVRAGIENVPVAGSNDEVAATGSTEPASTSCNRSGSPARPAAA